VRLFVETVSRRADLTALILVIAGLAVLSVLPIQYLVTSFVIDDALYYPKIAINIVGGSGVTYDGFTQTNGVQPLWELLWILTCPR